MNKKARVKLFGIAGVLLLVIGIIMLSTNILSANPPFTINETTQYGFSENIVYLTISENLGKNQVINVSSIFSNSPSTNKLQFSDVLIYRPYQVPIYSESNVSLGKYSKTNKTCITVDGNATASCYDVYYSSNDSMMRCEWVLPDKSCMIREVIKTGEYTAYDYLSFGNATKNKMVINGLSISYGQNQIPLAKNSVVKLKYIVRHPSFIQKNRPSDNENKYNISVISLDGIDKEILDPTWFNNTYTKCKNFTQVSTGTAINSFTKLYQEFNSTVISNAGVNSTNGGNIIIVDAGCGIDGNKQNSYVSFINSTTMGIWYASNLTDANRTFAMYVDSNINANYNNPLGVQNDVSAVLGLDFDEGTGNNSVSLSGIDNASVQGSSAIWGDGMFGKAINVSASTNYWKVLDKVYLTPTSTGFTILIWVKPSADENNKEIITKTATFTTQEYNIQQRTGLATTLYQTSLTGAPYTYLTSQANVLSTTQFRLISWVFTGTPGDANHAGYWNNNSMSLTSASTGSPTVGDSTSPLQFGYDTLNNRGMTGMIDETLILNKTLTANEVTRFYANALWRQDYLNAQVETFSGETPTDNTYPVFSNEVRTINSTIYLIGGNYTFNITISNTNGTAGINFGGTNYSLTNASTNFTKTLSNLGAGNYNYYYWGYGNGSSKNYNQTVLYQYTINQSATNTTLSVSPASPITYGVFSNFTCSNNIGTATLFIGGVDSSAQNGLNINRSAGSYSLSCNITVNTNYTATNQTTSYTINKANGVIYTYINNIRANYSMMNGTSVWLNTTLINGVGNINLYINDTIINSGTSPLGNNTLFNVIGNYTITGNYSGNANYTSASESFTLFVSNNVINSTPQYYNITNINRVYSTSSFNITSDWIDLNNTIEKVIVNFNGTNYTATGNGLYNATIPTQSAGTYTYYVWANNSLGFSNVSDIFNVTISKASSTTTLSLSPASPITYGTSSNFTCSNDVLTSTLYINSVDKTSESSIAVTRGVNTYELNCTASGNANYTGDEKTSTYIVNQGTLSGSIAASPGFNISNGTTSTVTGSESNSGDSDITYTLKRDSGTVSNPDVQTLAVGSYIYTYVASSGQNYTGGTLDTKTLIVSAGSSSPISNMTGSINFTYTNLTSILSFLVSHHFVTNAFMNLSGIAVENNNLTFEEEQIVNGVITTSANPNYIDLNNNTYAEWISAGCGSPNFQLELNKTLQNKVNNFTWQDHIEMTGDLVSYSLSLFNYTLNNYQLFYNNISMGTSYISINITNVTNQYYNPENTIRILITMGGSSSGGADCGAKIGNNITNNIIIGGNYYPTNLNVSIANKQIYYYPGIFNNSNNRTNNFYSQLNSYLSSCTYVDGYCTVPINFTSASIGRVDYSNVVINNDGYIENTPVYNQTAYATDNEGIVGNFSFDSYGTYSYSAKLNYDGVNYTSTAVNNSNQIILRNNIAIPSTIGNKSFYWILSATLINGTQTQFISNRYNQTVSSISFGLCNASLTVPYINFTFKNETTAAETIKAQFSGEFTYYLYNILSNKTYSFTNTSENFAYQFCFSPSNRQIYLYSKGTYSNSNSVQRSFENTSLLTNSTTTQVLRLLPNSAGLYVSFVVQELSTLKISNALVSIKRTSDGAAIEQKYTDDAGIASFFLDPLISYTITTSKDGYTSDVSVITPTLSSYSITLHSSSSNGGGISRPNPVNGIDIRISPSNNELYNGTTYQFSYKITSYDDRLDSYGFILTNHSGDELGTASGSQSGGETLFINFNTGNQSFLIMNYFYIIDSNYTNGSKIWFVVNPDGSDVSIGNFFDDLNGYLNDSSDDDGLFGLKTGTSGGNFSLAIMIFLVTFISTGIVSYKYGITATTAVVMMIFSIILFFDVAVNLVPNPIGAVPHFPTMFMAVILIAMFIKEGLN